MIPFTSSHQTNQSATIPNFSVSDFNFIDLLHISSSRLILPGRRWWWVNLTNIQIYIYYFIHSFPQYTLFLGLVFIQSIKSTHTKPPGDPLQTSQHRERAATTKLIIKLALFLCRMVLVDCWCRAVLFSVVYQSTHQQIIKHENHFVYGEHQQNTHITMMILCLCVS